MSFPNVSDIIATTIESRSRKIADNVTTNNALLARLQKKGQVRPFAGGRLIYEEISCAANGNAGWYSGYDSLTTAAADVITAAEFSIKQAACPVVVSGLEELQNSGREALVDLVDARLGVAEASMSNLVSVGLFSDGTGSGSKQLTGLGAAVPVTYDSGTYGGIDRATWTFWRSVYSTGSSGTESTSTIQASMNAVWAQLVRGADRPDLIVADATVWALYLGSLQAIQRFTDPNAAQLGFPSVKFFDADFVLDGNCTSSTALFLNTNYIHFRPHRDRNMVALNPSRRFATNQDASVQILGFAGNLTCSGSKFQGRLYVT